MFKDLIGKDVVIVATTMAGAAVGNCADIISNVIQIKGKLLEVKDNFVCLENSSTSLPKLYYHNSLHSDPQYNINSTNLYVNINNIIMIGL